MKHGLAPIARDDAEVLILGSLPGERSLAVGQYYGHPKNQFWQLVFAVLGEDAPDDYAARCAALLRHKIALWDVIRCAERRGSLDSDIRGAVPNDFFAFFETHRQIGLVLLNGGKAAQLFITYFNDIPVKTIRLPSSSPAMASLSFEQKLEVWKQAFEERESRCGDDK